MPTDIHQQTVLNETSFRLEEAHDLAMMRLRYQQDHDLFNERERAHLLFLRWCIGNGFIAGDSPLASEKDTLGGL